MVVSAFVVKMALCLKPLRIVNPHYKANGRNHREYTSQPDYYLEVPCGLCINCLKAYKSQWRVRLLQEWNYSPFDIKESTYFLTFTIAPEWLDFVSKYPQKAIKHFRDEYRRIFKCSCRYWSVTEYGDEKGRLHLHAILFGCKASTAQLATIWKYGFIKKKKCTIRRISYITKYITKQVDDIFIDKAKKQKVFCSPGIGKKYCDDSLNVQYAHPQSGRFNMTVSNLGMSYSLPRYYQFKIFTERERQLIKFDRLIYMSMPKPPYLVGKMKFGSVESFSNFLLEKHNVLHPLLQKEYEYKKQVDGLS